MIQALAAYLLKERDANRQKGFSAMNTGSDFIDANSGAPPIDMQQVRVPQAGMLSKAILGGMEGGGAEPSGWSWQKAADTAIPGSVTDGKFTPMAAMNQRFFQPYFGQEGFLNFGQSGPWRRK